MSPVSQRFYLHNQKQGKNNKLTKVAGELARPADRQQEDSTRDVVVARHVQVRQLQQVLVGASVLGYPAIRS